MPAADGARDCAPASVTSDDREAQKTKNFAQLRIAEVGHAKRPAKASQVPSVSTWRTPRTVVGRRVVGALLVAVVEAVRAWRTTTHTAARARKSPISGRPNNGRSDRVRADDELDGNEGKAQPEQVCGEKCPANEPAAVCAAPTVRRSLEDLG